MEWWSDGFPHSILQHSITPVYFFAFGPNGSG
jgi:hypothetical protein